MLRRSLSRKLENPNAEIRMALPIVAIPRSKMRPLFFRAAQMTRAAAM
jgi:hypothetical protein